MSYYKCPNCGSTDDLEITVEVRAKLIQYKDNFETEVFGDHEWDDESLAHCDNCNWHGEVFDLQEPDEEIVNGS